jgi:hypothetical protein
MFPTRSPHRHERGTNSDAWYALAPRIFTACNQLASVTYCLREWPEPCDTHADHDTFPTRGDRRIGRRVVGFWKDTDELDALYSRQVAQGQLAEHTQMTRKSLAIGGRWG